MKQASSAFFVALLLLILHSSCNDPTLVGSDLLEQDQLNVATIDTVTLRSYTVRGDSVRTFSPFLNSQLSTYLAGNLDDPIFGMSKATIYGQVLLAQIKPNFSNAIPDSLVLVLPYDTSGVYGVQPQTYGFEVYRVTEEMNNDLSYFSNQSFMTEMTPIGSVEKAINPFVGTGEFNPNVDSVVTYPHLRIKIQDSELINRLITDTLLYESDSSFLAFFKGIHLVPTTINTGMLAFDLFDTRSGMKLYYSQDTTKGVFNYRFLDESVKVVTYEHQYAAAPVKGFIEDKSLGDSLVFTQGMAGLETVIEIPYTEGYENLIVNSAIIEIFIANLPEDGDFDPATQLLLSTKTNGITTVLDDVLFSESNLANLFGGVVVKGKNGTPDKYVLNISTYFQDLLSGKVSNKLFLTILSKPQRASRSIFYGAGHSTYPIKLSVTFTKI